VTKILFLQTQLILDGPGIVVRNIIRHLDRSRYEPVVACLYRGGELGDWYRAQGIRTANFNMTGPLDGWSDVMTVRRIARFIRTEGIDLVHTHLVRADIYGRIASRLCGVPVISTVHNTEEHHTSPRLLPSLVRFLDRATARLGHGVVAVSDAVKGLLRTALRIPEARVVVIHNGVELPVDGEPLDRNAWDVPPDHTLLCTVGRLHEQKGIDVLVEAVAVLGRQGVRVTAVVVGDGPLKADLAARIRQAEARVILAGFQRQVRPFIQASDIFVLPSRWEGFGMAIVEAMGLGKPVVATRVGGIPEIVEDAVTGILCPPGRPAALAAAIRRLVEAPRLRRAMGAAGRQRAASLFTAQAMSARYQAMYRRVLAGTNGDR
jgi:glycosyltransferase involved in cell wall biosynthesis